MLPAHLMNGKPTGPQVQKFFDHIKGTTAGDIITHETIEALFGVVRGTTRYRTLVSTAKRRVFRELLLALRAVPGIGYEHPEGYTQLRQSVSGMRSGVKKLARSVQVAAVITDERLPEASQRSARDFIVNKARYLAAMAKVEKKSIELAIGRPEVLPSLKGPE